MQEYGNIMGIINDKVESQVWQTSWKLSVKFSLFRFAISAFQYETRDIYVYIYIYLPGSGGEKYDDNNLTLIPPTLLLPTLYVYACLLVPVSHYQTPILPIPSSRRGSNRDQTWTWFLSKRDSLSLSSKRGARSWTNSKTLSDGACTRFLLNLLVIVFVVFVVVVVGDRRRTDHSTLPRPRSFRLERYDTRGNLVVG